MRRHLAAALALAALAASPAAQECPHGLKGNCPQCGSGPVGDQRRVAAEVQKLEIKMEEVKKILRQKGQEQYAERLEQGLIKLKREAVAAKIEAIIHYLSDARPQLENALRSGIDVAEALEGLLALLEDRTDLQRLQKEMKEVQDALDRLKEIERRQEELKARTGELDEQRGRDFEQALRDLQKLIEDQKGLREETESGPPRDLIKQIDEAVRDIEKLQAGQREIQRSLEAAKSAELRGVDEFIRRLDDLAERQKRVKREFSSMEKRRGAIDEALSEVEKIIGGQKKAASAAGEAARSPEKTNPGSLRKEQDDLNERTWKAGHELLNSGALPEEELRRVLLPLHEADEAQRRASDGLREGEYESAKADQVRAVRDLERARDELRRLKENYGAGRPDEAARLQDAQEGIRKDSGSLAEEMLQAGRAKESPAAAKALENAGRKTGQASQSAGEARQNMQRGQGERAGADQQQALEHLAEAKQELERLRNALAQKDQPKIAEAVPMQKELSRKASELADRVNRMARDPLVSRQEPEVQREMLDAAARMRDSEEAMRQAAGRMQRAGTGEAQKSQDQAQQGMQQAKEALRRAREQMAGRKEPDLGRLAEGQKKVEDELREKVTRWLEKKADEEKDGKRAGSLREAGGHTRQAEGSMQEARRQMGQSQASEASKRQGEAQRRMEEARKKLEELARRPLNEEERRKSEELARRQGDVREMTRELERQLERMRREGAWRSAQSAQGNMQQAQRNLQEGDPSEAEEDEQKALEDLREARRDLEDALEEMRRQAEEELIIQLETELRKHIELQETVNKGTRDLDGTRAAKGAFNREEVIRARQLARTQEELSKAMREINKKLGEENVEVYRYVVDSVIDDMTESAAALKEAETGARTQQVQADAVRKMRELLEAFDIRRRMAKQQQGGGGGGGQGRRPLVPDIVQLNMMKKLQEDLRRRTELVERSARPDREDLTETEKTVLKRLADEQGKLGDLMKRFIEKFDDARRRREPPRPDGGPGERR